MPCSMWANWMHTVFGGRGGSQVDEISYGSPLISVVYLESSLESDFQKRPADGEAESTQSTAMAFGSVGRFQ